MDIKSKVISNINDLIKSSHVAAYEQRKLDEGDTVHNKSIPCFPILEIMGLENQVPTLKFHDGYLIYSRT